MASISNIDSPKLLDTETHLWPVAYPVVPWLGAWCKAKIFDLEFWVVACNWQLAKPVDFSLSLAVSNLCIVKRCVSSTTAAFVATINASKSMQPWYSKTGPDKLISALPASPIHSGFSQATVPKDVATPEADWEYVAAFTEGCDHLQVYCVSLAKNPAPTISMSVVPSAANWWLVS